MKSSKSEWLSFSAIVIAAIALIISAWQAFMIRHHNRISVQPLIDIEAQKVMIEPGLGSVWLEIVNDGLGPAIIESLILSDGGRPINDDGWRNVLSTFDCVGSDSLVLLKKNLLLQPGESLRFASVNQSCFFFSCRESNREKDFDRHYKKFMSIEVKAKYRTLYGKKDSFSYKLGELFLYCAEQLKWNDRE